jgi:cell wall-associated NlpC family hydrolase
MTQLDPRIHAYREDLAAASLQDRVRAPRYAEGDTRQVVASAAPVRVAPRFDAPLATEALAGELLTAYEYRDGWAWVQLHGDGYVGYMPVDCLSAMVEENTHRVSARLTYLYPSPDMKRPPITKLSFSCLVTPIGKLEGRFVEILRGGYIFADHIVGIRERAKDFVRVAERFVGVPYLWGGKTTLGIDCSGLVQISLQAAGIPSMRDSDMQMANAGEPQDPTKIEAIQRGDLLFWQGHVAIAQSPDWIIHASGYHMEVVVEPIRRALERNAESHGPLLAILRPHVEQKPAAPVKAPAAQPAPGTQAAPATQAASAAQAAPAGQQAAPRQAPPQQPAAPSQAQSGAAAPPAAPAEKAQTQKESLEVAAQLVAAKIAASMAPPPPQQHQPKERAAEPPRAPAEKPNPSR